MKVATFLVAVELGWAVETIKQLVGLLGGLNS